MKKNCSVTTETIRNPLAKAWPFVAASLLLVAASGAVRAQDAGEVPRVPFALSAVGETDSAPQGEGAGLSLLWRAGPGIDLRGDFQTFVPTATLLPGRTCGGTGDFGCDVVRSPMMRGIGATGGRDATVGGEWQPLDGLRLGVDVYSRQPDNSRAGALLLPRVLDFIAPGWEDSLSRRVKDGEGMDLSVAYGFDAGVIGELELQVELSQVLNQNLTRFAEAPQAAFGLVGQPENQASLGFNWSRGDFSGSVSSHYTDGIMLNGQVHPAAWTTVDINFAWRTPWNASLSLGAQNLLGQEHSGPGVGMNVSSPPELDSAFSRVPYVRYEQDL